MAICTTKYIGDEAIAIVFVQQVPNDEANSQVPEMTKNKSSPKTYP
jgi:hypothetical protein